MNDLKDKFLQAVYDILIKVLSWKNSKEKQDVLTQAIYAKDKSPVVLFHKIPSQYS